MLCLSKHDDDLEFRAQISYSRILQKVYQATLKVLDAHLATTEVRIKYSVTFFLQHRLNAGLDFTKLKELVIDFVSDVQIVFAAICENIDVSLRTLSRLMTHEIVLKVSLRNKQQ